MGGKDAAGPIYIGGVIRNNLGHWIKGYAGCVGHGNSLLAELWAIYHGLLVAFNAGCSHLILESDCLLAIQLIKSDPSPSTHHFADLVELCRSRLALFTQFQILHVLREGNAVADALASFAGQTHVDLVVFDVMPSFLNLVALADLSGTVFTRREGVG